MPRYAVYETQKVRVIYYVEADNPDQAHDMVATMKWDEWDELDEIISTDIDMGDIEVQTDIGWELVEY